MSAFNAIFSGEPLPIPPVTGDAELEAFHRKLIDYLRRLAGRLSRGLISSGSGIESLAAVKDGDQVLTGSGAEDIVTWETLLWQDDAFSHETNGVRIRKAGRFLVHVDVGIGKTGMEFAVRRNGVNLDYGYIFTFNGVVDTLSYGSSTPVQLAVGDFLEVVVKAINSESLFASSTRLVVLKLDSSPPTEPPSGTSNDEPFLTFAPDSGALTNNRVLTAGGSGWISLTNSGIDNGALTVEIGSINENCLLGRGAGSGPGVPERITLGTGLALSGTVLSATGGGGGGGGAPDNATYVVVSLDSTLTNERRLVTETGVLLLTDNGADNDLVISVETNGITLEKLQQINTLTLLGRSSAGVGNVEEISLGIGLQMGASQIALATNGVQNYHLRPSVGYSVIGRAVGTDGNVGNIVASNNHEVLRRSGSLLGFGLLTGDNIVASSINFDRVQNITDNRLLGRSAGLPGPMMEIQIGPGLLMSGGVLSNLVTQYTDEMAQDAVGLALQDSATISFTYDDPLNTITAIVKDSSITLSKLADLATSRVIGRVSTGSGVPEALNGSQLTTLLDTFTATLKGVVPPSGGGTSNFLRADGSWVTPPGGGSPAGSNTQVQYNNSGVFGANAGFTFDVSSGIAFAYNFRLPSTATGSPDRGRIYLDSEVFFHTAGGLFLGNLAGNPTVFATINSSNIGIGTGTQANRLNVTHSNTSIGYGCLQNLTSGTEHTVLGAGAGNSISTNNQCTVLGAGADIDSGASRSTAIGYGAFCYESDTIALGTAGQRVVVGGSSARSTLDLKNGVITLDEAFDPSAPASGSCCIYARNNGSGKTQLCVRFATGAVQVLATEP